MSEHHGKVWWNELVSSDPKKSVAFYTSMMGWSVDEMPMDFGPYYVFKNGDDPVAGTMGKMPEMGEVPDHWMTYLAVSDVHAAAKANKEAGGSTLQEPFDVPGVGMICMLSDPTGAVVGIMTPPAEQG